MRLSCTNLCILNLAIFHFLCFSSPTYALKNKNNNETDRLALLEFKSKITNDPLGVMSSWNNSFHFCQWYGVKCGRRHQRVTVLDLSSLMLSGFISPHVGNLSFLREFSLQNNSFTHEIPPQIGNLHRLQILSLCNNSIGGKIPSAIISNSSNLVTIDFSNNKLDGEIPQELGCLLKLKYVYLYKNNLTGTLPPSLGNLSSLQHLYVSENRLRRNLPHTLGKLKSLKKLIIHENQFSGTIPSSIYNISSIESIDAAVNNLKGNLPKDLDLSISKLPNLYFFSISINQFSGTMPPSFSNASKLQYLQLGKNDFSGAVPSFEKLQSLLFLNIAYNHLGGSAAGNVNDDDLKFLTTLTNASHLEYIAISNNNFGGQLPQEIGNFSKKLGSFIAEENQIFGNIPSGIFYLESLQDFSAAFNRLSGTIPYTIGKLQNLEILFLEFNEFTGSIPSSIGNLTKLFQVDLSRNNLQGIIPSSLANCQNLIVINLGRNNLSGSIPPEVFQLSSLSIYFGLFENHLTGSLPNEVGNLKNLQILNLDNNMLSGNIPTSLGSCVLLELLAISKNNFEGSIPSSLSSLRGIVELDVSHNNLSGKIPEFLKAFNSITTLNLSYNDFEGKVPTEGIFKNASATSVAGNQRLCGGIPDFGLPACKSEKPNKRITIKLKIIISTLSVAISAALVLTYLFLCYSKKKKEGSASTSFGNALLNLSYQSLLKATDGFSSNNLIGTGSFGSVYKGILNPEGIVIAVKVLNLHRQGALKSFIAEYEVPRTLNVLQRLNIAIDVACALEYLHVHCGVPIVHCDLKPNNILLDQEMTAHVSDFGLVKFLSNDMIDSANQFSSLGLRGTFGYCPPEYGVGSEVSTSGDIFSFGVLLLEMFTGKRPTDDMFKESFNLHNFVKKALPEHVTQVIDLNLLNMQLNVDATPNHNHNFTRRNNILTECLISILEIGISCSVEFPQERMKVDDVIAQLSSVRKKFLEGRN
ncbi:hypothetical protein JCGZ_11092 [Jatropha curcas]|uniref:non-specific serine/threonine protein kinase n=2 Tax=Jatropha curcas TaxID=180498 RepID=A0A067KEI9_JATCU|nr:hypothetical protein JCGZ_11092 [Jatropha curcas]